MSLLGIRLDLRIGAFVPEPAPRELMQAIESVQVTRGDQAPSGFQITFHAERSGPGEDYDLFGDSLLDPWNRVILSVTVSGVPKVLIDGFITRQELSPASGQGPASVTVTGEDISVRMDQFDISVEFPALGDGAIALFTLGRYIPLGLVPEVIPTVSDIVPTDYVPQQSETDRALLQRLAARHGYLFYIVPGPAVGMNQAYWGPPIRIGRPQKTLSVDLGPATNVNQSSFSYDALAPTVAYGMLIVYPDPPTPLPFVIGATTRLPPLATDPALGSYLTLPLELLLGPVAVLTDIAQLKVRGTLMDSGGLDPITALGLAQSQVDRSTDNVVTIQGQLDTVRYGAVLDAPGLVSVRTAGHRYDGVYYVKQVTHDITTREGNWNYRQSFVLTREGVGTTIEEVST